MKRIYVFDTTLRDGEQAPGFNMQADEKLEMALQLQKLGVDVIEAGFASQSDYISLSLIAEKVRNCTICCLARCRKEDIDLAEKALRPAAKSRLHLFIATSDLHMRYKLHMTPDEVLLSIRSSLDYARGKFDEIQFSMEDATRSDPCFLKQAVGVAVESGATIINLPDTVGYAYPSEIYNLMREMTNTYKNVSFATHCHNDLGLAVANTLSAIEGGATQIECTVNGIGERAGNTSLEEVVMALHIRKEHFGAETGIVLRQIYPSSSALCDITGLKLSPTKPIVGKNVFLHESGIHQQGVLANRKTYEILNPEELGVVENNLILGKHSGRHALEEYLNSMDIVIGKDDLDDLFERFKKLAEKKKVVTHKDIIYLMSNGRRVAEKRIYSIIGYNIVSEEGKPASASIRLKTGDEIKSGEGEGDGPLDAAFKTINRIIGKDFLLRDWSSSAITEGEDAVGTASLRLALDGKEVTGRGGSTDTLEASIIAYVNACNKLL